MKNIILKIAKKLQSIRLIQNEGFWFEWGSEPQGFYSCGYYDKKGRYHSEGNISKERAKELKLKFHCPYN